MSYYKMTSGDGGDYGGNSFASLLANAAQSKQQHQQQQFDASSPSPIGSVQVQQSQRYSPNSGYMSLPSSTSSSGYQSQAGFSSPESSLSSLYTTSRARFMCSKGFELEDDIEFCPRIVDLENLSAIDASTNSSSHSPQTKHDAITYNSFNHTYYGVKSKAASETITPKVTTPRIRKPLEIVDPHTGMRIESSKFSPHSAK